MCTGNVSQRAFALYTLIMQLLKWSEMTVKPIGVYDSSLTGWAKFSDITLSAAYLGFCELGGWAPKARGWSRRRDRLWGGVSPLTWEGLGMVLCPSQEFFLIFGSKFLRSGNREHRSPSPRNTPLHIYIFACTSGMRRQNSMISDTYSLSYIKR